MNTKSIADACAVRCSYSDKIGGAEQAIRNRAEELFLGLLQYDQERPARATST